MRNNSTSRLNVPQTKQAMDQFKMLMRQRGRQPRQGPDGHEDVSHTKCEI